MLYAINFKESGEILTPESYKKYWPNYGGNNLHGWKAPKKVYYTLGKAKNGFSHVPDQLKPLLEISEFTRTKSLVDGEELMKTQKEAKFKKEEKLKIARAAREKKYAEERLAKAKADYERLLK